MNDIFANIYLWFEGFYGSSLSEYLWGYNCATEDYSNPQIFKQVGLMMSGISLGIALVYYYVINHPEFAQFRHWFIMLIITAVINLFAGWGWVYSGFINGEIGDCVMYAREASGSIISQLIYASDCWMFGVANAIVSIGFFCIFSLIVKWKSSNAGHSPF